MLSDDQANQIIELKKQFEEMNEELNKISEKK